MIDTMPDAGYMPLTLAALCLESGCNTVFQVAPIVGEGVRIHGSPACPKCGSRSFQMLSTWINRKKKKPDISTR